MKSNDTSKVPPSNLDRYHKLLKACCEQFNKVGEVLAEMNLGIRPKKKLGTRWTATANKLLLDTTQSGNAARLYVVAENPGLGEELRKAQEVFDAFAQKFICEYPADINDTRESFRLTARITTASISTLSVFEKVLELTGKRVKYKREIFYPTDEAAREILVEGVKRRGRGEYRDLSWREIALSLLEQERRNGTRPYWARMMGQKKGHETIFRSSDNRVINAARNWGKYLSYYSKKSAK